MKGYPVVWEDENGQELGRFDDPGFAAALLPSAGEPATTAVLRFIDPYGDTVLNQRQLGEILRELGRRRTLIADESTRRALDRLVQFLGQCAGQVHTYVRVVGD